MLEQNFYQILEVTTESTPKDIDRAYRIARATYQPASMATYSVFSDDESGEILRRIEEAYAVLSDARMRREYNARLRREQSGERVHGSREPAASEPGPARTDSRPRRPPRQQDFTIDEPEDPSDGIYDGHVLRRIRISRGIELDEISEVTKITETYLQFIEANRYDSLPSKVYLRGFLREFAKCLALDPDRVAESYLAEYETRTGTA